MSKYAIHSDFGRFPVLNARFGRVMMGFVNAIMALERWLAKSRLRAMPLVHHIAGPAGNSLKVLQFAPPHRTRALPALVYYHGGAFAMTYASLHMRAAERYALEANCQVFLADYRLAPRHLFPAGFDDCYAALEWVAANAAGLGVDPARIAVMGDSAGGAMTAGVAQRALDEGGPSLCGQLMVFPVLDRKCDTPSARDFVDVPLWNASSNRRMWEMYLPDAHADEVPAYASPADREQLAQLPAAYVETAEFDPLRDEGIEYANRLAVSGVETELNQTCGTVHGFDAVSSSAITQEAYRTRVGFLRKVFSGA